MKFKDGVSFKNVNWRTFQALTIAEEVYEEEDAVLVVTSLTDGLHGEGVAMPGKADHTLHDDGLAADLRTRQLAVATIIKIAVKLRTRLPQGWQVVVESDHIHMEYDPATRAALGHP